MVGVFCGSSIKKQYLRAVLVSLDLPSPTVFEEIGDFSIQVTPLILSSVNFPIFIPINFLIFSEYSLIFW